MDNKKELKQLYKETPIEAGVYQIKNNNNQKIYVGSTRNFKTLNGVRFQLDTGSHINRELQEDWKKCGKEAFAIEILETLKKGDDPYFNEKEALTKLEEKWLDHLQPYGEHGYNSKKVK